MASAPVAVAMKAEGGSPTAAVPQHPILSEDLHYTGSGPEVTT